MTVVLSKKFPVVKELEDCDWFPALLRRYQTDYIGFAVTRINVYGKFVEYVNSSMDVSTPMTDLCSGSGEPAITIFKECPCFTQLTLNDKFPSRMKADDEQITYCEQSVDVNTMKFQAGRCYTMFNAFHHFTDKEKLDIVSRIQNSGSSAFIVEPLEPGLFCLLKVIFAGTIGCLLVTPFMKPFSFARLFFTWIVPVNLLTITIDGIISVFKSKSDVQYRKMFALYAETVDISRIKSILLPIVVIQIRSRK